MSKFFRSHSSSSSSSSSKAQSNDDETQELDDVVRSNTFSHSVDTMNRSGHLSPTETHETTGHSSQQALFSHALLEYYLVNEAAKEQPSDSRRPRNGPSDEDDPQVRASGEAKYQSAASQLAAFGLLAPGYEGQDFAATRARVRDGVKALTRNAPPGSARHDSVPAAMRKLLTGPDDTSLPSIETLQLAPDAAEATLSRSLPFTSHSSIEVSRFAKDFEELGILGQGGYGIVHRVRHRLDGRQYAVKKIPISGSRLRRIKERGQREIDDLLLEVKTLADLEHHNIVRYHNSWIEWVRFGTLGSSFAGLTPFDSGPSESYEGVETVSGATDERLNSLEQITTVDSPGDILFENSESSRIIHSKDSTDGDEVCTANALTKVRSRGTVATVSDEDDVESISRSGDTSRDLLSGSASNGGTLIKAEPVLALHIQMAFYPLTLADFLSPPPASNEQNTAPPLRHCFHLRPSIDILLAALDGLDYLHSQSIIHRDIKPANIFMAPHDNPRTNTGAVDLMLCDDCRASGTQHPVMTKVRIGDFGLVTSVAGASELRAAPAVPVGTVLYRPDSGKVRAGPHLDIFALGVVAFELLWRFDTRMERLVTLQQLRKGCFPADFNAKCDRRSGGMEQCIRSMLFSDGAGGPSIKDIKKCLRRMLAE